MTLSKLLETDLKEVSEIFPKLKYFWNAKSETWFLKGELDICDDAANYWGTYEITILIPRGYPFCIPLVKEDSTKIPREDYRHISKEGYCCLDIEHNLLHMSRKGILVVDFIRQKVYPYFANQLYYDKHGYYAGEEYAHHFAGVKQFYMESLGLIDNNSTIAILNFSLSKPHRERNAKCPCGSQKKFKYCHLESVVFLSTLGRERLLKDLEFFKDDDNNTLQLA